MGNKQTCGTTGRTSDEQGLVAAQLSTCSVLVIDVIVIHYYCITVML